MKTKEYIGEIFSELPLRLRELRKAHGYSQDNVATIMKVSRVAYGNYERVGFGRFPDAKQIHDFLSDINKRKGAGEVPESADYLLCMSNTKNPIYAKIAETTGLTDAAIEHMETATSQRRSIINALLEEEPRAYVAHQTIENAEAINEILPPENTPGYSFYLDPVTLEMKDIPDSRGILEFVKEDWLISECFHGMTSEEICPWAQREAEATQEEIQAGLDLLPKGFNLDAESRSYEQYEKVEAAKSNLLSRIAEYVEYQSGCTLCARGHQEELSSEHALNIGVGSSATIQFPSTQSDELFEFMLIQKVIDALRTFKSNYYERNK